VKNRLETTTKVGILEQHSTLVCLGSWWRRSQNVACE